jgi:hypothetical protein
MSPLAVRLVVPTGRRRSNSSGGREVCGYNVAPRLKLRTRYFLCDPPASRALRRRVHSTNHLLFLGHRAVGIRALEAATLALPAEGD